MWTRVPGYGGNVEGRRSTRRALDAGILNHVGPVFSAGRSDPRRQDVTINVRRCAIIHRWSGFDLPRTLARSPRRSRGVLPRWWLCREAIVGRSATQSTATPASRRQGGLWPAPAPQLVSWSVRLRRPCGGVRGAAGWAFREQARDRRRAPRRPAPARDRWLRVQRPARRHLTDRRSI